MQRECFPHPNSFLCTFLASSFNSVPEEGFLIPVISLWTWQQCEVLDKHQTYMHYEKTRLYFIGWVSHAHIVHRRLHYQREFKWFLFFLLVLLVIDVDDWGKSVYKGLFQGAVLLGLGKESQILGSRKVSMFVWVLTHNSLIGNGPPISLHDESSAPCLLRSLWSSWDDQPPAHLVCFCMRILV